MSDSSADQLRLSEAEQLALAASSLWLMNRDIDCSSSPEREALRDAFREELRAGPLGQGAMKDSPLAVEERKHLEDLLQMSADTPKNLAVLIELMTSEPFAASEDLLDEETKRRSIEDISITMGGRTDEDDVERIHRYLREGQKAAKSKVPLWAVVGVGGLAGVLTAGMAAPAIGAAIGGVMGLQGAAATAAGLAWLGGGAVAAGGFGMAGGSVVVAMAGAATGVGIATLVGNGLPGKRIEGEALKAYALARSLQEYEARNEPSADGVSYGKLAEAIQAGLEDMADELAELVADVYNERDYDRAVELDDAAKVARRLARNLEEKAP